MDNHYLLGLLWQQRADVCIALVCAVLCTISNLAAPVISGYFIEILAGTTTCNHVPTNDAHRLSTQFA